jgi:riboflavin synthase
MFTGIVEELGTVVAPGARLVVGSRTVAVDSDSGASVAVNGVCLTVVERTDPTDGRPGTMSFDVSGETLDRSSLGHLRAGDPVNLERPVTLLGRLGGHLVQGHVDGVGRVSSVDRTDTECRVVLELPPGLDRYVVEKGSIAVDGVSLTVATVDGGRVAVALVPHTLEVTTLGTVAAGHPVNIEVDLMAKYVERLLGHGHPQADRPASAPDGEEPA